MQTHTRTPKRKFTYPLVLTLFLLISMAVHAQDFYPIDYPERTYELYIPESYEANNVTSDNAAPLMIVLHGAGGTGSRTQGWLGIDALAEEYGFIVAYPDGVANDWDFGSGITVEGENVRVDDVGFLAWLVDQLAQEYNIDTTRVFVVGNSDGASMAYRLICEAADTFAAAAGVSATLSLYAAQDCATIPRSVLFIHGTEDHFYPWGRTLNRSGQVIGLSAIDTLNFWGIRNQCSTNQDDVLNEKLPDIDTGDRSTVTHIALGGCADNTEVHFYAVEGGGHTWPGHEFDVDFVLGPLNMDMDASAVIVEWFAGLDVSQLRQVDESE